MHRESQARWNDTRDTWWIHRPDLVTMAYGVNDARAGTAVGQFIEDLRHIVVDIKSKTGALIVMLSTSFMTDFKRYPPFDRANITAFESYNAGMRRLAEEWRRFITRIPFPPWHLLRGQSIPLMECIPTT